MPLISIIIPVYNSEANLAQCLDSIVSQLSDEIEVIMVNDGSTDRSGEIIESYQMNYPAIQQIQLENGGISNARNTGMKQASGDYLIWLDADDYMSADFLVKIKEWITQYNADLIVYGYSFDIVEEHKKTVSKLYSPSFDWCQSKPTICEKSIELKWNTLIDPVWNKVFKRSVIQQYQLGFPDKELFEDTEFIFHYLEKIESMVVLPDIGYHYIQHRGNRITSKYYVNKFEILLNRVETMLNYVNLPENKASSKTLSDAAFFGILFLYNCIVDTYSCDPSQLKQKPREISKSYIRNEDLRRISKSIDHISGLLNQIKWFIYKTNNVTLIILLGRSQLFIKQNLKWLYTKIR